MYEDRIDLEKKNINLDSRISIQEVTRAGNYIRVSEKNEFRV